MLPHKFSTGLVCLLVIFLTGTLFSQTIVLHPQRQWINYGEGLQYEAQAFSDLGMPLVVDEYEWSVSPETAGTISNEGYFVAGDEFVKASITATARIKGERVSGDALVIVGESPDPEISIVVEPEQAIVEPMGTLTFAAIAKGPNGISLRIDGVRWLVSPRSIGMISDEGVFTAGPRFAEGTVTAVVDIEGVQFKGEAEVLVSSEPTGSIFGTVTDESGSVIDGAQVAVIRLGIPVQRKIMDVSEDGSYMFDNLVPGNFVVVAEADGYIREFYNNVTDFDQTTPVSVGVEEDVTEINFELGTGGSITGVITDEATGDPIEGVSLTAVLTVNPTRRYHALSDVNGEYAITGMKTGSYAVFANKSGYVAEYYDNVRLPEDVTPVSVTAPDETSGIDMALTVTNALTGIVTSDADGSPIEGAIVAVRELVSESPQTGEGFLNQFRHVARTDENGAFSLQLNPGFYLVYTRASDFVPEWFDGVDEAETATPVQIFEDQHTEIEVGLAPFGSISGTVTDENTGLSMQGVRVAAFYEGNLYGYGRKFSAITDENGDYIIPSVPTGEFFVAANADSYLVEFWQEADSLANAAKVTVESGVPVQDIDFTLSAGGILGGQVVDSESATPLENAIVRVERVDGKLRKTAKTDADGFWTIKGLPAGSYLAIAVKRGYEREWYLDEASREDADEIELLDSGSNVNINFTLAELALSGSGISGVVMDESGEIPVEGAIVTMMPLDFAKPRRGVTGPDGSYEILGVTPGDYIISCRALNYVGEFYDNVYSWLDADAVTVETDIVTPDINFNLAAQEEGAYTIKGMIVDKKGNAKEGALVVAKQAGEVIAAEITEADGSFLLHGVPAGKYSLMASQTGYDESYLDGTSEENSKDLSVGDGLQVYDTVIVLGDVTTAIETETMVPVAYQLEQNYPNPFNPSTTIRFVLPNTAQVKLQIFNLLGKNVRTIFEGSRQAGAYSLSWDGTDNNGVVLASGMYIYRLEAQSESGRFVDQKRMIFIK